MAQLPSLGRYAPTFAENYVCGGLLAGLEDKDLLLDLGVTRAADRSALLAHIASLLEPTAAAGAGSGTSSTAPPAAAATAAAAGGSGTATGSSGAANGGAAPPSCGAATASFNRGAAAATTAASAGGSDSSLIDNALTVMDGVPSFFTETLPSAADSAMSVIKGAGAAARAVGFAGGASVAAAMGGNLARYAGV